MLAAIRRAVEAGGKVLIPSFAVGRAQVGLKLTQFARLPSLDEFCKKFLSSSSFLVLVVAIVPGGHYLPPSQEVCALLDDYWTAGGAGPAIGGLYRQSFPATQSIHPADTQWNHTQRCRWPGRACRPRPDLRGVGDVGAVDGLLPDLQQLDEPRGPAARRGPNKPEQSRTPVISPGRPLNSYRPHSSRCPLCPDCAIGLCRAGGGGVGFRHIQPFRHRDHWPLVMERGRPMVLFAAPGMLNGGLALQAFKEWSARACPSPPLLRPDCPTQHGTQHNAQHGTARHTLLSAFRVITRA